jgi:cytoskeletal protein CcmA (bactofilin family)
MFRRGEDRSEDDKKEYGHRPIEAKEVRMSEGTNSEVTVVGQGARLEGTIVSAGSLRIDGQVKGKVNADGDVVLSSQSQVEADIQATNATVAGRFKGNLMVKSKAEVAKGGRVDGNITSKTLVVAEGAIFSGQSIMGEQAAQPGAQRFAVAGAEEESSSRDGSSSTQVSEADKVRAR